VRATRGAAILCLIISAAAARAQGSDAPEPFSRIGLDLLGDGVANASIRSKHPVLMIAGVTYKLADLAHDIGAAAISREDRWLGAELVLVDEDGRRLEEMKHAGIDLNGPDATAVKQRLRDRMMSMTAAQTSPAGYTARVITKSFPYAVAKVTLDKVTAAVIGRTLAWTGITRFIERHAPLPKKINWALNYGGPLEEFQKGRGWGKLGTRARAAQKVAEEMMHDLEKKQAARELREFGANSLIESTADALSKIYAGIMKANPSRSRTVVASAFRLEVARQAVPAAVTMRPRAEPAFVPFAPVVMRAVSPDAVALTIRTDDGGGWERMRTSDDPTASEPAPLVETEIPVDPRDEARHQAFRDAVMRVGNGKTDSSWDGRRGETILPKKDE
jgi:hypothetical protein